MSRTERRAISRARLRARAPARSKSAQRGQALTEMAILAVVLVPLFLLIPLLAKYAHLQQNTQQAARAAAWEATVVRDFEMERLNASVVRERLIDRHFSHADTPISTAAQVRDADDDSLGGSMYNTHSGQPLLERQDIALAAYEFADQADITGRITNAIPDFLPGEFPPSRNGLATAHLTLRPQNIRYADGSPARDTDMMRPFDSIDLEFTGKHTLLADAWGAAGSGITSERGRSTYQQVRTFVPSTMFSFLGDGLDSISGLGIIPIVGALTRLRPGYAREVMDVVPEDRLQAYPGE
ncbi:MAG: TadE/TadG family type IV pilus assembly protein [Luteimonas sp.]